MLLPMLNNSRSILSYSHILYAVSIFCVSHSFINWVCLSCWLLLNIWVVYDIFLITIFFLFNVEVVKIKFRKHRYTRALMTLERLVSWISPWDK